MWHEATVAVDGSSFNKVKAKNNARRIHFVNETNQKLKQFLPHVQTKHMNQYSGNNPLQQRQHIFNPTMYYASPMEPMKYSGNMDNKKWRKKIFTNWVKKNLKLKEIILWPTIIVG